MIRAHPPRQGLRRTTDKAVRLITTFLTGFVVGALATFAGFSGRVSSLETTTQAQSATLTRIENTLTTVQEQITSIRAVCAQRCK